MVSQNVKLQLELDERKHTLTTNNPYATPFTPKFPDIKVPKIEIPHIEISTFPKDPIPFPKWVGTCKPDTIKCGMDLADGPDETVEEWKKEDKPEPNLEELMQELDEDTVKSVRKYVEEYAKQQEELFKWEHKDENKIENADTKLLLKAIEDAMKKPKMPSILINQERSNY